MPIEPDEPDDLLYLWTDDHSSLKIEARAARDEAIERVDDNADAEWKEDAYSVVMRLAKVGKPFTADEVWEVLGLGGTHEPAALGPVFLRAAKASAIVKTGRLVPTRFARRHRELTEWIGVGPS